LDAAGEARRGQRGTTRFFEELRFAVTILEQAMSSLIEKKAVVIGAGMGGLAAAKALSNHFGHVTVLDRDILPSGAEPRNGTPQARHAHLLIGGGLNALADLFPGFEEDLQQSGAVKIRAGEDIRLERPGFDPFPKRDMGWDTFSMSRPLLEAVTRRRVGQLHNVTILARCRVKELVASHDGSVITAVRYETADGQLQSLHAELFVEASGRGTLTLELLDTLGLARPEETEIGIDQAYSTAIFEQPKNAPSIWKGIIVLPSAPSSSRGAFLFPIENNRWIVSLGGNHGDAPPGDMDGFLTFLKGLRTSTIYDAVKEAKQVGEIIRYLLPCSLRRHFERMSMFPGGLVPIGDAVCRFNPVFGQGMSVAAQEAVMLNRLLDVQGGGGLEGLAPRFFAAIQEAIETPWGVAISDFVYPSTRGTRPSDFSQRIQYGIALTRLAAEDPSIHKLTAEVGNLLKPQKTLREPEIAKRVAALMTPTG
jgi:2-polyprenyl-6-methoxyphenol hydroxylase-like FAD-dependent oxidoreductase